MMKGRQGEVLWDDTIRLGIELRKKLRAIAHEFEQTETDPDRQWFFDPFVPDTVEHDGVTKKWEDVPTDDLAADSRYWQLTPGAAWHGYRHVTPGYAMTDPNKLTLLTPASTGGPAATPNTAFRRRCWRSICVKTASSPRRTTSTAFFSC